MIRQNTASAEPTLADLFNLFRKDLMLELCAHHIGTIESFDSVTQTAKVSINYKKTYFESNSVTKENTPVLKDYPVLADVPCVFLGGGGANLTFPVASGDECILLFNDRDIDNWFSGSSNSAVNSPRLHSFTDAIAIIGVRSLPNLITTFDADRAALSYGTTILAVGATLIKFQNDQTTLKTVLNNLITQIDDLITATKDLVTATAAITVTTTSPGNPTSPPLNAAAINMVTSSLSAVSSGLSDVTTEIGNLLE